MPLDEIDVNVHPAKTEVRFRRGEAVKDAIAEAVRSALAREGIVAETSEATGFFTEPAPQPAGGSDSIDEAEQSVIGFPIFADVPVEDRSEQLSIAAGASAPDLEFAVIDRAESHHDLTDVGSFIEGLEGPSERMTMTGFAGLPPVDSAARFAKPTEVAALSTSKIQPIGQLHESFIIAVDDEGLLLIDQHVAHERILFDKYRRSETEREPGSQNLLLPETIDLTPAQSEAFDLIEDDLATLGFGLMRLSGRTIAIKGIPTDLPPSEARNLFAEILDTIEAEKKGAPKSTLRDDIAASLACKAAVKINMKLTPEKMRWLIDRLLMTTSPTTCPHGRPVILRLSMRDIERGFHRT